MGSTTDKIKGATNEAIGKAKRRNRRSRRFAETAERRRDAGSQGHGQKAVGHAKDAAKDAADKVADVAHKKL